MLIALVLTAVALASAASTAVLRAYALRRQMLDVPNARSSHSLPTPRGGGVAIVLMTLTALGIAWTLRWVPSNATIALLVGGSVVALVGWLDDRDHVAVRWRMLVHLAAGAWMVACVGGPLSLPLPGGPVTLGWLAVPLGVLWVAWTLNLYNFMDGIDGIAGMEAATVSAVAAVLLWQFGQPGLAILLSVVGAASVGFLFLNWPPAKIFMGDAGSAFLGFLFGGLALITHALGTLPIWSWLILLAVFLVDATVTLMRRLIRGERVYQAHRSHAYQHAARAVGSHLTVTVAVGAINLFWLAPLAVVATWRPEWGIMLVAIAWTPLVVIAIRFSAGVPEARND